MYWYIIFMQKKIMTFKIKGSLKSLCRSPELYRKWTKQWLPLASILLKKIIIQQKSSLGWICWKRNIHVLVHHIYADYLLHYSCESKCYKAKYIVHIIMFISSKYTVGQDIFPLLNHHFYVPATWQLNIWPNFKVQGPQLCQKSLDQNKM
jgi:hypothetical protein